MLPFATASYDQQTVVDAARELTGRAPLAGCSAEGLISSAGSLEDAYGVQIGLLKSDTIKFRTARARASRPIRRRREPSSGARSAATRTKSRSRFCSFPMG